MVCTGFRHQPSPYSAAYDFAAPVAARDRETKATVIGTRLQTVLDHQPACVGKVLQAFGVDAAVLAAGRRMTVSFAITLRLAHCRCCCGGGRKWESESARVRERT